MIFLTMFAYIHVYLISRLCFSDLSFMMIISEHQRAGVVHLSNEGLSTRQIALRLKISNSSVSRILKKFKETGYC